MSIEIRQCVTENAQDGGLFAILRYETCLHFRRIEPADRTIPGNTWIYFNAICIEERSDLPAGVTQTNLPGVAAALGSYVKTIGMVVRDIAKALTAASAEKIAMPPLPPDAAEMYL